MLEIDSKLMNPKIKSFAELYFNYYVVDGEKGLGRGIDRFKKNILDDFKKLNQQWLENSFAKIAEIYDCDDLKLNYDGWFEFITDDEGDKQIRELLYQVRLGFAELYRKYNKNLGE
ncbi:hypothetical protein [Methanococcus sp. CF]